jgi:carbon storage regulator CsrA
VERRDVLEWAHACSPRLRRKYLLVLTRKTSQSIVFTCEEAEVRLKIIRVGRDKVSLGVEAPLSVKILRSELQGDRPAA